jgi:oxygen-dependent protoporphyrinogen oxidase
MDSKHDVIIIGSGLSGLSVAHFLQNELPAADVVILESSDRPGGAIRTDCENGFQAEWGAHGFLDNIEASRRLLAETGLDQEAQKAPLGNFVRYVCLGGRLAMIPQSPKKILASSILPFTQKLRILADLWKKPRLEEQSVRQWVEYRFGHGLLPFADAVFTGTYAGDFERLSIDAVMPGIRELEKEAGSVLKGLIKKMKAAQAEKSPGAKKQLPAMISFPQGMGRLPERLAQDKNVLYSTGVESITRKDDIWELRTSNQLYRTGVLVLALPVNRALSLIAASPEVIGTRPPLKKIPEARIATVVMGFPDTAQIPFGFGYLAPEQEKRFALGALFSTHMFPGRAPEGHVMLEALVGGRRHPEKLELDDDELIRRSYEDLRQLMDLPDPPCFSKVLRTAHGIPQLEMGYPQLLAWRAAQEKEFTGLHLCGFGWWGVGINDMVKAALQVATAVAEGRTRESTAAVKGVYF